ncbi:hypothetical protein L198_05264 [Cryptococcus wingfieldii CBS 7118]|uniref:SHSP domain-containing protein n=1 Tax=Cryptococcus wingfieldii CBS 7118 TaxID=1295528 RepID=A0A1E3IXQ6_9TREE|nr:hypothetical protein L198_05264 [Cryptococcus wingfieldii CBS 7118]ODN93400.1 hypothetical protein L198_05264 [Cryptococcus wingfieldii CBS 7118]
MRTQPPPPHRNLSAESTSSSAAASSPEPHLSTPDLPPSDCLPQVVHPPANTSPSGSTTSSTGHSKGESTPRAEVGPPVWPLAAGAVARRNELFDEPYTMSSSMARHGSNDIPSTLSRTPSLKRAGSYRKKHASLDTPPNAPRSEDAFPSFTALNNVPPLSQSSPKEHQPTASRSSAPGAPPSAAFPRQSTESHSSSQSRSSLTRSHSPASGCEISAPISPPVGYPLSFYSRGRRNSSCSALAPPSISSASTASSSSGNSANSTKAPPTPPPPRWARPPAVTNTYAGRAMSLGSGEERPDVNLDDFDPELFEGVDNEWIEVIKGSEGRIAIKSIPTAYEILVWLPGFSLDNITIATRGHRTIHIVADQWDEGDHAQWDIKLGEDANLRSVNAKFTGKELRVTVARQIPEWQLARDRQQRSNRSIASASTSRSTPAISGPSITSSKVLSPLERAAATSRV